ncbi:hypothetical protein [Rhodoblastus sp.]|uniref:hypothetical protein n=2 Tax=Rhodoblastus sp. TaxID=1962975 RepID=UPI003F994489
MQNRAWFVKISLVGAYALMAASLASPAQAQNIKTANGTAYWDKDPGPIDPGSYWTSGQYKYDPNGYMERNWRDPDQFHLMTLYADHAGKQNCVFRRRVVVSTWDFQHPYLRVCRRPQTD